MEVVSVVWMLCVLISGLVGELSVCLHTERWGLAEKQEKHASVRVYLWMLIWSFYG